MDLITEILRGMRDTTDACESNDDPDEALLRQTGWTSHVNCLYLNVTAIALPTSTMKDTKIHLRCMNGSTNTLPYDQLKFTDVYRDEYTGQPMNHQLTKDAIVNEIVYVSDKVWRLTSKEHAEQLPDSKIIGGRWVMTNKGDEESPKFRRRYVATEVGMQDDVRFYAATPPLEAKTCCSHSLFAG